MKPKKQAVADVVRGKGGELHQTANGEVPILTTQQGTPVSDDQNSLKVGARGPTTLEDFHLREKIFHFDHERIPERVVHARGFGAHGYFENYESLSDITAADLDVGNSSGRGRTVSFVTRLTPMRVPKFRESDRAERPGEVQRLGLV